MTALLSKLIDRFVETAIDDETVVMDMNSGEFFSLNHTAGAVWRLIDGTRNRDTIVAHLAADFGLEAETIAAEIDEEIGSFREAGFIGG